MVENVFEELNQIEDEEDADRWEDWNCDDYIPPTENEEKFAEEIFNIIQSIIDSEEPLNEEFASERTLVQHFYSHCIAKWPDRKSKKSNVYYDFTNIDKYRNYENEVNRHITERGMPVQSLFDTAYINDCFRKLFREKSSIYFLMCCEFRNAQGPIAVGIHSYSSWCTKNYTGGNTIDFMILSRTRKTIMLYPVDAHYLETKINNVIRKYTDFDVKLKFNND